jgi:intraflagellar transport protein 81
MEIQAIVDRLNAAPFHKHLSLVSFDEQTPLELLATATDVLREVSVDYAPAAAVAREDARAAAERVASCLRVLNYRSREGPEQLVAGLQAGDHSVVFPALHWLLSSLEPLKKRAYLAKFLVPVEVPEELFMDDAVVEVYEQYKHAKEEFKEVHRAVDATRADAVDPEAARQEIARLDQEKDQLQAKTAALADRLRPTPGYDEMLAVVSKLRRELDEEVKLKTTLKQQQTQLTAVDERHNTLSQKLRDLQSTKLSGGSLALLEKLREETQANARRAREELPAQVAARREREQLVRSTLAQNQSEADLARVQADAAGLERELTSLREQRDAADAGEDKNLKLFRQQATLVARKRTDASDRLHAVTQERTSLEAEMAAQGARFRKALGTDRLLKGDQFNKYAASLRVKHEHRKKLKAKLAAARVETGVLERTVAVLGLKRDAVIAEAERLERQRGATGHVEMRETLERVSKDKANVDQAKGEVLEEISRVVEQLHAEIRERKTALAPLVKRLRATRAQFAEVEGEWSEKKTVHDNIKAGLESKLAEVRREVAGLRSECLVEESRFHFLHAMLSVQETMLTRARDEAQGIASKNWRESYKAEIQRLEKDNKALTEQQRAIKASHDPNMRQLELFRNVKKLLHMKVDCLKRGLENPQQGAAGQDAQGGRENYFSLEQ